MKSDYLESPFKTFYFALRPYRWRFFAMLTAIIIGNTCGSLLPYFLKLVADKVLENPGTVSFADLSRPFIFLVLVFLFQEIFNRIGHIIETYVAPEIFRYITTSLFEGLVKRPTSYFENKFSGDLGRRIEQVGSAIMFFVESFPWTFGWMATAIIGSAFILSLTHWYIFLTFIGWVAFFILTSIPVLIWHYRASKKVASSRASLSGSIIDTLSNIPLVQAFGGVPYEQSQNEKATWEVVMAERKMRWISVAHKFQCGISQAILGISLTYVSVLLFTRGEFTVGDFVLVSATIPSLIGVIWNFGEIIIQVSRYYGELSDAVSHLREKQEQLQGGNVSEVFNKEYSIEFRDVSFQYPATKAFVFDKFSLGIKQGERVGIVGASGVGKSTLVKLLLRQHEFGGGSISIGGVPIQDFSLEAFHKLMSYVPQDTSLFHRSLFENIKYAKISASDQEVFNASQKAKADEFIKNFPSGYETKVGERGVKLSGGQRQRIALARAILKNAPILILDEATSSLDTESESFIQEALLNLFNDRTVIAIAHRLSTLRAMDRIIVLENGLVAESGSPQELLQKEGGIFKKMWEHQKDGFIT